MDAVVEGEAQALDLLVKSQPQLITVRCRLLAIIVLQPW